MIDGRVVEACRDGDREAFRLLYDAYKDRVYSIAFYFSRDENSARDIVQETFLKIFNSISQFRGDANFSTWLYRVIVNACIDEQRRRKRFVPLLERAVNRNMVQGASSEESYMQQRVADSVKSAVATLRPALRVPILLRYVEGLSYNEIAEVLGCSSGTVASRLNRAHKILAHKLRHLRNALEAGL